MTSLVIISTQSGLFTVYERCVGLSNSVRQLGRVQCADWEEVTSGRVPIDPAAVQDFRANPTMYDEPAVPVPDEPRVA